MLSPSRDDDADDTHLCIKCNATIIGLDNYVKHRKQRCAKNATKSPKVVQSLDTLEPTYSGADVFFQSLELQSSVKKPSLSRLTPPITIPTKNIQNRKSNLNLASTSRDARMSPLENHISGEDWIGGHSIRIGHSDDNQTKLINAVANISGVVKKDIPTSSYSIVQYNDYKGDEDSDDASEDTDDDDDDEEEPPTTGGKWKPPAHHTGGKWRPDSPENEVWYMKEDHTGGKWKPMMPDADEDYDAPPPGHTKGKWVPGAQDKTQIMQTTIQTKTSVQYWCGPCNRRLGSRAIYEKHLLSNLHLRKILPENDLEFAGHMEPKAVLEKRTTRASQHINENIYQVEKKRNLQTHANAKIDKLGKKKRKRKPYYTQCSGCKSRVKVHLMGKHLISHYHFRKASEIPAILYEQLILENMDAIVSQSPFQCSPCKFYTNLPSSFTQHWDSEEHKQKTSSIVGRFWCSFCKFECDSSQDMLQHLLSTTHDELVAVINRSMPIVIRKKTIFKCNTCLKEFRYNIEVKKHCQKTGHELIHTATDLYQEFHECNHCRMKFRSSLKLAAHLKIKHKQKSYVCLLCSKTFSTSLEAQKHRYSSEHKIRRKESLQARGMATYDLRKKCPHCVDVVLRNVLELKEHIQQLHPDMKKKCPKCGMAFILSQEVTRHVRANACKFNIPNQANASTFWSCSQCLFITDSQAECFFHEVLHTSPTNQVLKVGDQKKIVHKFTCPLCPKTFRKSSLRFHIRQHTFERPFLCTTCGANFTRQSSLANHSKAEHGLDMASSSGVMKMDKLVGKELEDTSSEQHRCNICLKRFASKSYLKRHSAVPCVIPLNPKLIQPKFRDKPCTHAACDYVAATAAQLVRHKRTHGESSLRQHECQFCQFSTNQSSHMKRHMTCHAGVKPYACPHCEFKCGSLENLRKHVLRSTRHPARALYGCRECAKTHHKFSTNMASLLRAHLVTAHHYDAGAAVQAVKNYLLADNDKLVTVARGGVSSTTD